MTDSRKGHRVKAREFSPAEMAVISGVSAELQRAWRKRKILPGRRSETLRWARFGLAEVLAATVARVLADLGTPLEYAACIAERAQSPLLNLLLAQSGNIPQPKRPRKISRYMLIVHYPAAGEFDPAEFMARITEHESKSSVDERLEHLTRGGDGIVKHDVLHLQRIADQIIARSAGEPLFLYEPVEVKTKGETKAARRAAAA